MKEMFEIRWHGRGVQGAKTAALLFGDAACSTGKYVQAFPEYGPERMGAPVVSFNRISSHPIRTRGPISNPDIVVVLDVSLVDQIDIKSGLDPDNGKILLNSSRDPQELKKQLDFNGQIFTVDASKISRETIGRDIPNTPLMGALIRITNLLDIEDVIKDIQHKLEIKFKNKPDVIEGNLKAIRQAYDFVKGSN